MSAQPAASHPKGLYVLFAAEAWERFSYYGMRALLVLYLVNHLEYAREDALAVYGMYTGLVYLTPFFGGLLADRLLGSRKAILIGGILMALGHLAMAVESLLFPALGLLILGNGFFKPNISTIVGGLYEKDDPRRDGGFTIFYMGINLGAFFSPLVCGTLGEKVGWHYGFSAAGVGMVCGLLIFLWGQKLLGSTGYPPEMGEAVPPGTALRPKDWMHVLAWVVGGAAFVFAALAAWPTLKGPWEAVPGMAKLVVGAVLLGGTTLGILGGSKKEEEVEGLQRTLTILVLTFFNIFFWMGFEQAGGTMTLFADQQTDRHLFGWEIPASYFQSINPLAIVALAPLFSVMWTRLDAPDSRFRSSTPTKMAFGMITLGIGFIIMYFGQQRAEAQGMVGPMWLATVYFVHTLGELMLSPIGLSMVTRLAPAKMVSLLMGAWFFSSAVANYLAGTLEHLVSQYDLPVYGVLVATSIGAGLVLLALTPLLKRWMHGRG
jgi:proton-dependent oligopeptide transporter, POT family